MSRIEKMVKTTFLILVTVLILIFPFSAAFCQFNKREPLSLSLFLGPASTSPLVEIARFRELNLVSSFALGLSFDQTLWANSNIALQTEQSLTQYMDGTGGVAFGGAFVFRWLKAPWSGSDGKTLSTFAFGNGLSYTTSIPEVERSLPVTSRTLYYLFLEVTYSHENFSPWEFLFRIHHRSGAFGLFGGVVGGSDFLCLGVRRVL